MKRITAILALSLCLSITSCSSFLNVDTLGKSTIEGFFSDIDGLKAAGIGLHRTLLDFYDDQYLRMGDIPGDCTNLLLVNANAGLKKLSDFESLPEDNSYYPYSIWKKAYNICTNANNILYYGNLLLEKNPMQEEIIKKHFGYAYFSRALAIFDLCNVYAMPYSYTEDASHLGVVAIDHVPGFNEIIERHSIKDCYEMIISDLNKGLECFGGDACEDPHYISGLACEALLARVYLYMGDYAKAESYSEKVKTQVPLVSRDKYVDMFRRAQDVTGEAIFRLNSYEAGTGMSSLCSPVGSQDIEPTPEFLSSFNEKDIRRELFTYNAEDEDGDAYKGKSFTAVCKYVPYKYCEKTKENRRCDPFVLRVSEMYLIHAEAICRNGGDLSKAVDDIKELRARAMGMDKKDIALNFSSSTDLDLLIQEERKKELCFEGHRFFDLKRRGENIVRPASTTSKINVLKYPDYRFSLPICQMEMQANENMKQNEGYEE